jgi:molybdopterin synthase sulfur carrier subunit
MVDHRGLVAWTRIRHVSDQLPRAAARAAAGIAEEHVAASTLAELLAEIGRRHGHRDRFHDVIGICSILVGETPVGAKDPADVGLAPGTGVEFLPPFAGG